MIIKTKHAVCPVCHETMNHLHMNKELVYLKFWSFLQCRCWIQSNSSDDGAFQYREMTSKNKSDKYEKWKNECFEIMKEKFWNRWDFCSEKNDECKIDTYGFYFHNLQWCNQCGYLYPNEYGLPSTVAIHPTWLKRIK